MDSNNNTQQQETGDGIYLKLYGYAYRKYGKLIAITLEKLDPLCVVTAFQSKDYPKSKLIGNSRDMSWLTDEHYTEVIITIQMCGRNTPIKPEMTEEEEFARLAQRAIGH